MQSDRAAAEPAFRPVHLDFESGTFEGWSVKRLAGAHSARFQSEVVRTGALACRFELRPGDYVSQGHRAELRDPFNASWGQTVWYGFATLMSDIDKLADDTGCVLAQWHDQAKLGDPSGKPPLAIRYRAGKLTFTGAYGRVASPEPDIRYDFATVGDFAVGVWHDFVVRILWARYGDCEIEVWLDSRRIVDWRGPLAYENEEEGPYFKLGAYWSPPGKKPVVVFHDNYSRGHSYAEVDPAVPHGG